MFVPGRAQQFGKIVQRQLLERAGHFSLGGRRQSEELVSFGILAGTRAEEAVQKRSALQIAQGVHLALQGSNGGLRMDNGFQSGHNLSFARPAIARAIQYLLDRRSNKSMANMVFCAKYKQEMEGLDEPPFDSELGQKVYKTVSKKAWGEWVERQKMLLNEYRLQPWTPQAQEFLVEQMNEFFYGSGGELPKEYVAPTE